MFLCHVYVSITPISDPVGGQVLYSLKHFDVASLDKIFQRPGFISEMFSKINKPVGEDAIGNITLISSSDPVISASYSAILTD